MSGTNDFYKNYMAENPVVTFWLDEKEKGTQTIREIDVLQWSRKRSEQIYIRNNDNGRNDRYIKGTCV